ncbi:hypothetical protein SSBR45G_55290 [Bradyrhizobium sp. SSBR45G]|uniref:hypothetical protein n=1 Tax=unclassified Bradyrhizobium TaxID=2631580 RepID=UPI002342AAB9|nr:MULTISPECIES: hypothetical protein [unclassified Bradyrhizobium]GLH80620.1 hypothetical protein SSBR45G_55290 [Bradyrhizobium sp. SSBR45G]GLH85826.1 hypothetical protein SSBR45R_32860 [Bradyrhizobium sp. SSBR45R]
MIDIAKEASAYQIELFQMIGEFWGRATGMPPEEFSPIEGFGDAVRKRGRDFQHRVEDAFTFADTQLRTFYAQNGVKAYRLASRLGGTKLVLGGASNFGTSQLASTRSTLLYADTVLIPDPLYPWLEDARQHERFRLVRPLQAAHAILHLRPLIDANLPHCPLFVFPSFEKSLEREDDATRKGIDQLVVDVLTHFVDPGIGSFEDAHVFANTHTDDFIRAVERNALFVPPEANIGEPVAQSLQRYDHFVKTWRTAEYIQMYRRAPVGSKVLTGIFERLTPNFHLFENAEELGAHPLLSIEQQGHYFKLVSEVNADRLSRLRLLDEPTRRQLAALSSERLEWLNNIPVAVLAELREDSEHEVFRKMLATAISNLHASALENVDKVAAEICREIDSGIARYNRSVREINDKFKASTAQTAVGVVGAGFGLLVPALAPFLGSIVPLAALTKLGHDALTRHIELKKHSRSLIGVLAIAKDMTDQTT